MRSIVDAVRRGWPGPVAFLAALALYGRTLAPGLTWAHQGADGGDLLAAALTGGVPHPSGYPTYQLLLRAAVALYPGEPARAGNWLSALAAACAVGLLADLARRVLAGNMPGVPEDPGAQKGWHAVVALAAALTWAASPLLWSQAVITEVYTLHALAVMLVLWLLWRWREATAAGHPATRWLAATGLALGLGLGNHLSLALLLPAVAAWLWLPGLGGRFSGQKPGLRTWLTLAAGLLLGLSVYAYLPLAAAGGGPVNWGDPCTLAGFWWVVSGRPYAGMFLGLTPTASLARVSAWAQMALNQLGGGPWGLLIALMGLWWTDRHQHTWWRTTVLVALAYTAYSLAYRTTDSYVYLLPVWAVAALWLAAGLGWICSLAQERAAQVGNLCYMLAIAALVLLPSAALLRSWHANDLSEDHEARDFIAAVLAEAEPHATILVATDRPTFALWYAIYGLGQRPDLVPLNVNLYDFDWYRAGLHRRHPGQMLSGGARSTAPALETLVQGILTQGQGPLYRAESLDLDLPGLRETPAGVLVRISPDR